MENLIIKVLVGIIGAIFVFIHFWLNAPWRKDS